MLMEMREITNREKTEKGIVLKGIGGFYYVETTNGIVECKAKGKFRNLNQTLFPGDRVEIENDFSGKGRIVDILTRKSFLLRPTVANLDKLFLVVSIDKPKPNLFLIDNLIAILEFKKIEPIIIITKTDLADSRWICDIYLNSGFKVYHVNNINGSGSMSVKAELIGSISAFSGNTGVGKTSLINKLFPELEQKTSDISEKLGRGKHTTRHVELFRLSEGGYVADTPGFSTIDTWKYDLIKKEDLQYCFREFLPYLGKCRFTGCSHTSEKGCLILEAVHDGIIKGSRHNSYCQLYEKAKNIKEWELK